MPIPQNSHSSKPMVTFIEKLLGLFGMAIWSKITVEPNFLMAEGRQKGPILQYWTPVWYLLLQLLQKLGFMVILLKWIFTQDW